jgi:hypothetical protein
MPKSFWTRLKEIDMFFGSRGPEHRAMRRVVMSLEKAKIPYAVVGGMAVNAHGCERTTNDVDSLLSQAGFAVFRERFVPRTYDAVPGRPHRFWDRQNRVNLDILVTGDFPGSGEPGPIAYPDPRQVARRIERTQVIDLPNLITLNLAARRYKDFADVISLIRANDLDESFCRRLHGTVHGDYLECLEEMRREEDYVRRQDEAALRAMREERYPPRKKSSK